MLQNTYLPVMIQFFPKGVQLSDMLSFCCLLFLMLDEMYGPLKRQQIPAVAVHTTLKEQVSFQCLHNSS